MSASQHPSRVMVVAQALKKSAREGVARMWPHQRLVPEPKEQEVEESRESLPMSSSGPTPSLSCFAPAAVFCRHHFGARNG